MHVGAGCIKSDLHTVGQHVGQQAVHAVRGGLDAHFAGTLEAVGLGVNPDHPDRLQKGAALQLGQQVGADVAGPDQGTFDFFHKVLRGKSKSQIRERTTPPSTRNAAPLVAAERGLHT